MEGKPPLGVPPNRMWLESRFNDLHRAICEYFDAGLPISVDWVYERNELIDKLKEGSMNKVIRKCSVCARTDEYESIFLYLDVGIWECTCGSKYTYIESIKEDT
jgi:hypothetical protein